MGTRATIIFKYAGNSGNRHLYRHYDGYPEETMYDILALICLEGYVLAGRDGLTHLKSSPHSMRDRLIGLSSAKQFCKTRSFKSQYRTVEGVSGDSEFLYIVKMTYPDSTTATHALISVELLRKKQWDSKVWDKVCTLDLPHTHDVLRGKAEDYVSQEAHHNFAFSTKTPDQLYRFIPETWQNIWDQGKEVEDQ